MCLVITAPKKNLFILIPCEIKGLHRTATKLLVNSSRTQSGELAYQLLLLPPLALAAAEAEADSSSGARSVAAQQLRERQSERAPHITVKRQRDSWQQWPDRDTHTISLCTCAQTQTPKRTIETEKQREKELVRKSRGDQRLIKST